MDNGNGGEKEEKRVQLRAFIPPRRIRRQPCPGFDPPHQPLASPENTERDEEKEKEKEKEKETDHDLAHAFAADVDSCERKGKSVWRTGGDRWQPLAESSGSSRMLQQAFKDIQINPSETMPSKEDKGWRSTRINRGKAEINRRLGGDSACQPPAVTDGSSSGVVDLGSPKVEPESFRSRGMESAQVGILIGNNSCSTYERRSRNNHKSAQPKPVCREGKKASFATGIEEGDRNSGGFIDGHCIPLSLSGQSLSERGVSEVSEIAQPLPPKKRRISSEIERVSINSPEVEVVSIHRRRRRRSAQQSTSVGLCQLIEVDDGESPRRGLEHEVEKQRQIAEDERIARLLQQEFESEVIGGSDLMDDAQLARMLQNEEATQPASPVEPLITMGSFLHRNLRPLQGPSTRMNTNSVPVRAHLAGSSSSAPRARSARFQRATGVGHVRSHQQGRAPATSNGRRFHFPHQMDVHTRMELLATLETAFNYIHEDRDFNENDYEMLLALDENNDRHAGAAHDRIHMLPVSTVKATDVIEEACSICLEEPVAGDKIKRLPCMHGFHQQCIDTWLDRQAKCPVCKVSI